MKKRTKPVYNIKPKFPPVPTKAYDIRRSRDSGVRAAALKDAINQSRLQIRVEDLDKFLDFAEPWVDRDILRAHLLADGDVPSDTQYVLAFVRGGGPVGPARWTIMPPAASGTRPVRCLVVGTPGPVYDMAAKHGGLVIGLWAEWIRLLLTGGIKIEVDEMPGTAEERHKLLDRAMVEWIGRNVEKKKAG